MVSDSDVRSMLRHIFLDVKDNRTRVIQHECRRAYLHTALMCTPRNEELENLLSKRAHRPKDNYTTYEVIKFDGTAYGIFFTDNSMFIGLGVVDTEYL